MLVVAWPLGNFNPDAKKGNSVSMVPFMLNTLYLASWFNVYSFKFSIKTNLFLFFFTSCVSFVFRVNLPHLKILLRLSR